MKILFYTFAFLGTLALGTMQAHAMTITKNQQAYESQLLVNVNAKLEEGATRFIDDMANQAIAFLGDDSLSAAQKEAAFRKLLERNFSLKTIGRFALGRYWRVATPAQQKEYLNLFQKMVISVYSARFGEYSGQQLDVRDSKTQSGSDIVVHSFIAPEAGAQEVRIDWRVRHKNGRYKVVDVIVEGVSMAVTQRADFASVIQRGGGQVSVLLDHLRK